MKGLKTGGRQKGTPNKTSMAVPLFLEKSGMNLVNEAVDLYRCATDPEFKLKILTLLFPYAHSKQVDPVDDTLDVTPEDSAAEALDYIKENFPQLLTGKDE